MSAPGPTSSSAENDIDFLAVFRTLWSGRLVIIAIAAMSTGAGIAYSLLAQEWFRAEVVLAPASKRSTGAALSQVGGLASLAGINLQGAGEGEPLAVLKSRDFARTFIADLELVPALVEPVFWRNDKADIRDALRVFDLKVRSVTEDKKTGLVTLGIRWKDPETAASWANILVTRLNARMRDQASREAERNVSYLQKQIAETSVIALQQSLGRVLEGELQKLLLAQGNEEFAFKVIDRATPPKYRDAPRRTLITLLSGLLGVMLGVVVVLSRRSLSNLAQARGAVPQASGR